VLIDASPEPKTSFVGSPSIVIMPDGSYVASHDFFGAKARLARITRVFSSTDRGATWSRIGELNDLTWATLFLHRGALYLIGAAKEYGNIVLRRSTDGGRTWTRAEDGHTGVLVEGRFHCGPTPVVFHDGRIWRAFEHYTGTDGSWSGNYFESLVVSAPEDADLLDGSNWTVSNKVHFNPDWIKGYRTGWLEGNVVVTPQGGLVNVLRVNAQPSPGEPMELDGAARDIPRFEVAAMISISPDGRTETFDPQTGFFRLPGSQSKFTIRFDPTSGEYWSLVNKITNPGATSGTDFSPEWQRNVVMLVSSKDLRHWQEHYIALRWREGLPVSKRDKVAFQYLDWQFDGDDIVAVSRTSWGGATYHNANMLTFHRIKGFRTLTMADSALPLDGDFGLGRR
jgi:hypothetical protein